jgi:hypothetical protein
MRKGREGRREGREGAGSRLFDVQTARHHPTIQKTPSIFFKEHSTFQCDIGDIDIPTMRIADM